MSIDAKILLLMMFEAAFYVACFLTVIIDRGRFFRCDIIASILRYLQASVSNF